LPTGDGQAVALGQTFAASLLLAALNAATGILAARLLGPVGRGELAAVQLWPTFLATLAVLGLPDALVYFASADRRRSGRYLGTATALALGTSVLAMLIGFPLLAVVLHGKGGRLVDTARLYLLICPLFVLAGLPFNALRGAGAFGAWNAIRVVPSLLWLGILTAVGLAGSPDPLVLPKWHLLGLALLVVPIAMITATRVPGPYRPDGGLVRPILRYGLPGMAASVPQQLNLRLDQMLMASFLPTRDLGLYVAAVAWSGAVSPLVTAVGTVLFPSVAQQTEAPARAAVLAQGSRLALLLTASAATVVGVLTWPGLRVLFGPEFGPAVPAALVLVAGASIVGYGFVLQEGLRGLGLPRAVLRAELTGLAVSMAVLAVLLPLLGILGAAMASVAGYSAVVAVVLRHIRRATGMRFADLLVPGRDDVIRVVAGTRRLASRSRRGAR